MIEVLKMGMNKSLKEIDKKDNLKNQGQTHMQTHTMDEMNKLLFKKPRKSRKKPNS